jgi:hypothetical protein
VTKEEMKARIAYLELENKKLCNGIDAMFEFLKEEEYEILSLDIQDVLQRHGCYY